MVNEIDYEKMWEEIQEEYQEEIVSMKKPHEKTISDLRKEWNMSQGDAEQLAEKLVKAGRLGKRPAKSQNGRKTTVYFPI